MRRFISLGFILGILFIAFQCEAFADSIRWDKNLDIGVNSFNGVAQSPAGLLAAVGEDGVIKTSPDGAVWTGRKSGTTECFNGIVWGNDRFIAVGEGVIAVSLDGIEWQVSSSTPLNSVAYMGNRYVAVGKFGTAVVSDDGVNWTSGSAETNETLCDVYFDGNQVIALGENGGVYTSFDGIEWSKGGVGFDVALNSISRDGSRYEIVTDDGEVFTSLDCKNWNWVLSETAGGNTSSGGNTVRGALRLGGGMEDIIWDGKMFVAVGVEGDIFTSVNGINWTKKNSYSKSTLHSVIWTGTQYVAVGESSCILTSPDAVSWTLRSSGRYDGASDASGGVGSFKSVVWGKDKFVVVGDSGIILYSPDGEAWTRSNYSGDIDFNKVIWNGKKFAVVGSEGTVLFSSDGINWTRSNTGIFSSLNSIAWNGRIYAVVGPMGEILTSADGIKWTIKNTGVYNSIDKIVWDKSNFAAVEGKGNALLVSSDGVNWSRSEYIKDGFLSGDEKDIVLIPTAENMRDKAKSLGNINQIIWNGTEYISVGSLTESNVETSNEENLIRRMGNSVMTSADCITWKKGEISTCRNINSIAWNGERLVAVGDYRVILNSIPAYIEVLINGEQLTSDIPPVIRNNRTLIPLRAIFEVLGLSVGWDEATKTITGTKGDTVITLRVGSTDALVNGRPIKLDSTADIISGRTMVPVRFIAESLGAEVTWDKTTKTILIKN